MFDISDANRSMCCDAAISLVWVCFSQFEVHCGSWDSHAPLRRGIRLHAGVSAAERRHGDPRPPRGHQRPGTQTAPQTQTPNVTWKRDGW